MVEVIAISVVVAVVLLGILLAVPKYVSTAEDGWPDILTWLNALAESWLAKPRVFDLVLGIVTIVFLAASVFIYQDPAILGDLASSMELVAHTLAILGFVGIFSTVYLSVRRAGISGAEATLIGSTLAGVVLIVLVSATLIS